MLQIIYIINGVMLSMKIRKIIFTMLVIILIILPSCKENIVVNESDRSDFPCETIDNSVNIYDIPILYNMNKINYDNPLLITSGELDYAAAIEAGYLNAVIIPLGNGNTHWVIECWDFLENFKTSLYVLIMTNPA
ncbi:MAG TPA: hypothetical protein DCP51_09270 [Clostridiales bacterium]|nr:hypothetical protein [Clostridiales bacterium]